MAAQAKSTASCTREAMFHYKFLLHHVVEPKFGRNITSDLQLARAAHMFLEKDGPTFSGVYMADELDAGALNDSDKRFAIMNLTKSPGTHWVALSYEAPQTLMVYDSFGDMHEIPARVKRFYPRSFRTDEDVEQGFDEQNCGQRAIAWLLLRQLFGKKEAWCI